MPRQIEDRLVGYQFGIVRIPLTRQARDTVVEQLTGGISVAQPGDIPKAE